MQLTEQHNLKTNQWDEADNICFLSKNLYNLSLYHIRQFFFEHGTYLNFPKLDKRLQQSDAYKALPAKVAQQVLKQVDMAFRSFFRALQVYKINPEVFNGRPRMPGYLDKQKGRNLVVYTDQAISKKSLKENIVQPSKTNIKVKTRKQRIAQVRLVPKDTGEIILEVVYNHDPVDLKLNKLNRLAIDLGVNNLCAITSDIQGFKPILVKGGAGKAINQFYNKEKASKQSKLEKGRISSKSILRLTMKRNRKINHLFHQASKFIVETCKANDIGTIVIGRNLGWKQDCDMGKVNNQNFVGLPFYKLINQIHYKAEMIGIQVIETNESYTSKCSFLDMETIEHHDKYVGKRVKRGLYKSSGGREINADVNGSLNIMRKAFPEAFAGGIEGVVVHPRPVIFTA